MERVRGSQGREASPAPSLWPSSGAGGGEQKPLLARPRPGRSAPSRPLLVGQEGRAGELSPPRSGQGAKAGRGNAPQRPASPRGCRAWKKGGSAFPPSPSPSRCRGSHPAPLPGVRDPPQGPSWRKRLRSASRRASCGFGLPSCKPAARNRLGGSLRGLGLRRARRFQAEKAILAWPAWRVLGGGGGPRPPQPRAGPGEVHLSRGRASCKSRAGQEAFGAPAFLGGRQNAGLR